MTLLVQCLATEYFVDGQMQKRRHFPTGLHVIYICCHGEGLRGIGLTQRRLEKLRLQKASKYS